LFKKWRRRKTKKDKKKDYGIWIGKKCEIKEEDDEEEEGQKEEEMQ
jgi:hypothetical protein